MAPEQDERIEREPADNHQYVIDPSAPGGPERTRSRRVDLRRYAAFLPSATAAAQAASDLRVPCSTVRSAFSIAVRTGTFFAPR